MKNIGNILKQAQQMQGRLAKMQEELAAVVVNGQAGGGMVEVSMNGRQEVQRIKIDPGLLSAGDVEMLEDLLVAAFNDAQKRINTLSQERMSQVTGGLSIPGLNLPT